MWSLLEIIADSDRRHDLWIWLRSTNYACLRYWDPSYFNESSIQRRLIVMEFFRFSKIWKTRKNEIMNYLSHSEGCGKVYRCLSVHNGGEAVRWAKHTEPTIQGTSTVQGSPFRPHHTWTPTSLFGAHPTGITQVLFYFFFTNMNWNFMIFWMFHLGR